MRWDDFARVSAPILPEPRLRGIGLGWQDFPSALTQALNRMGVVIEDAGDFTRLEYLLRTRTPDLVIVLADAIGPDPEEVAALIAARHASVPAVLVTSAHQVPYGFPDPTCFSELLGSGQDALGYFLMMRATLRRKRPHAVTDVLSCGHLALDQEKFMLTFAETHIALKKLQFCVLGAMLDAPRMVWSKAFLNRVVFGPVDQKPGRQFDSYMSLARRLIRNEIGIDPIVAQHRIGYALSPTVLGSTIEGAVRLSGASGSRRASSA